MSFWNMRAEKTLGMNRSLTLNVMCLAEGSVCV